MHWTKRKPDRPGWWWLRNKYYKRGARVALVDQRNGRLMVVAAHYGEPCIVEEYGDDDEWSSSPVLVPEELTESARLTAEQMDKDSVIVEPRKPVSDHVNPGDETPC